MRDAQARLAQRDGLPVLEFFILVYRSGSYRRARSIYTGDVAESGTEDGVMRNLLQSIDLAIDAAVQAGVTAEQWYAGRLAIEPEARYVQMFKDVVADQEIERMQDAAPNGHYFREFAVARSEAA